MKKFLRAVPVLLVALLSIGAADCYKPVTNSGLPKHIKRVAVPAFQFEPRGARYKVGSRFTDAVIREMLKRGRGLKVQATRKGADAVVEGTIRDFTFSGVLLDKAGRARVYEVVITSAVTITEDSTTLSTRSSERTTSRNCRILPLSKRSASFFSTIRRSVLDRIALFKSSVS